MALITNCDKIANHIEPLTMNWVISIKRLLIMNLYSCSIVLFGLLLFSFSCAKNPTDRRVENITDIDKAMNALNEIQVNGDGNMMLYLTYPNIPHNECVGVVSTFEISREEFHDALIEVMSKNNRKFMELKRASLASVASKPLGYYTLTTCGSTTKSMELVKGAIPPRQGTWIIPEIFGVSDLLINW